MKFVAHLKKTLNENCELGIFISLSVLLTFLIFGEVVAQKPAVDADLKPIVQYYSDVAARYGVQPDFRNLVVGFVDKFPVDNWIGLCQTGGGQKGKFVSIRRDYFEKVGVEQRYALVIHELGHCTLGLDHKDGYRANGCPVSNMHPSDGMFGCFFRDQDYYFREMFGKL